MAKVIQGDPYEGLANAVIIQACDDYRDALKKLKKDPGDDRARFMRDEVERFFRSGWYKELTSVDGEMLARRLREEAGL